MKHDEVIIARCQNPNCKCAEQAKEPEKKADEKPAK